MANHLLRARLEVQIRIFTQLPLSTQQRIVPLSDADYAAVPEPHTLCPRGIQVKFCTITRASRPSIRLDGYLITPAESRFPLDILVIKVLRSSHISTHLPALAPPRLPFLLNEASPAADN